MAKGKEKTEITHEIREHLGVIYSTIRGRKKDQEWAKEVNIVSWNGNAPKIDIREWNEDHTKSTKGLTLTNSEAEELMKILQDYFSKGSREETA